jgi:hypothetical protein
VARGKHLGLCTSQHGSSQCVVADKANSWHGAAWQVLDKVR